MRLSKETQSRKGLCNRSKSRFSCSTAYRRDCMDLILLDASVKDKDAVYNPQKASAEEIQHRFLQLWIKAQPSALDNYSLFKKHNTTQSRALPQKDNIICKG